MKKYECRVCNSDDVMCMGILPEQTYFAGEMLDPILPPSKLYKCNSCLLLVRHPILSQQEYNKLYAKAEANVWSNTNRGLRPDQLLVINTIIKNNKDNCKVLDIGCYTGDLLTALPKSYLKFGVEMSKKAALVAVERGIKILGNDLYEFNSTDKFDVVTAIDVIEHTQNPEKFILNLIKLLNSNGEIIISTGNSDNLMWRILKNKFWYSAISEHISFIGYRWLNNFCKNNNLLITEINYFNYTSHSFKLVVKNIVKSILSILRVRPSRYSNTTKDHFYFSLKINAKTSEKASTKK